MTESLDHLHPEEIQILGTIQQGGDPRSVKLPGGPGRLAYILVQLASYGFWDRDLQQLTPRGQRLPMVGPAAATTTTTCASPGPTTAIRSSPPQSIGDDRLDD